jgi:hypothetical protein
MQKLLEPLEGRALFAVSIDAAGFTSVTPAADTRRVYVSSSLGNDANDGSSEASPVRTLGRAQSLVRDGSADWLLLRRGDTFGSFGEWKKRGRSASEPLVITAYGNLPANRPQINSGTSAGFYTYDNGSRRIDHLVISSLSFFADTYNHTNGNGATAGIRLTGRGTNITIEDCRIAGYKDNIVLDAVAEELTDVKIRRNQIVDAHAGSGVGNGHAQGIYVGPRSRRITIEGNVLDHNGWRQGVSSDRTWYSHNIYTQTGSTDVVVRDNIITRAAFYGVKFNGAGTIEDNFFARNSESVYLESPAVVEGNVITEAVDHPNGSWGVGINTQKSPQADIRGNLITQLKSTAADGVAGIQLYNNGTSFRGSVTDNVVYHWRNALLNNTPGAGTGSVHIERNQFQAELSDTAAADQRSGASKTTFVYRDNVYSAGSRTGTANRVNFSFQSLSQWVSKTGESGARYEDINYPDPGRTIGRYAGLVSSAATFESFIGAARVNNKANWNASLHTGAVNAWMWGGFRAGGPTTPPTAPQVTAAFARFDVSNPLIQVSFSADVGASISPDDLLLRNTQTGQTLAVASAGYSESTRTAYFMLSSGLTDGMWSATVRASGVQASTGAAMAQDHAFNFTFLVGDANGDGRIDILDFAVIAANYNQQATFVEGDFNFTGRVDIGDFSTLVSRYNKSLATLVLQ